MHNDRLRGVVQSAVTIGRPVTPPQRKPRLLFLCHTMPYPPDGGVWIRTYNVIRLLAREFDITILCFERAVSAEDGFGGDAEAGLRELERFGSVEVFAIHQLHSRTRFVLDHLRSLLGARVFTRYLYESDDFRNRLVELLESGYFELVHVDSLDLSAYLPLLPLTQVICVHHNIESQLLRRRAAGEQSLIRRWYIQLQGKLMEAEERRWCDALALNVTVSDADSALLREISPGSRCAVVPNGVDTEIFRQSDAPAVDDRIVFVGGANWHPNRDGLVYFCTEILPLLREELPEIRVDWVGACSRGDQRDFQERYGIRLSGYVEDIRPLVHNAACYVVPLRVGGGSRLKILDAWAMGKAVVSTTIGCEGLAAEDGKNILVADTPGDFAAATIRLLRDEQLRVRLGQRARDTVEEMYSWDRIGQRMNQIYTGRLDVRGPSK